MSEIICDDAYYSYLVAHRPFNLTHHSLYAKYYFALRSLLEKSGFRDRYNQMVGGIGGIAASEAIKVSKRSEAVKEEALLQLSRSM